VDEKAWAKAEAVAFQHFEEEMNQCKDCKCTLQTGMPCVDHQTKITLFAHRELSEAAKAGDGVGDGKQPDAVPAALTCQNCHAVPASVDSRFCDGCTKKLQVEELEFIAKKQKKE
jgi:hypothetical protein